MESLERVLSTAPGRPKTDAQALAACAEACAACELTCNGCADACLAESNLDVLRRCIRLNLDCADVCASTGRMLSRGLHSDPEILRGQVRICERVCSACAAECEKHAAHHEHCRHCANECRRCETTCRELLRALVTTA